MTCFPKWSWQAGSPVDCVICARRLPVAHCTAPPRRGRSFRSIRIGWYAQARTGSHRARTGTGMAGNLTGPKPGGKQTIMAAGGVAGC